MYKMLSMVLNRSSERIESNKIMTMIEANGAEEMEAVASPRVMNSHYPYRYSGQFHRKVQATITILKLKLLLTEYISVISSYQLAIDPENDQKGIFKHFFIH